MTPECEWVGEQPLHERWVPFDNVTINGRFRQPSALADATEQLVVWREHYRLHFPNHPVSRLRVRNLRTHVFVIVG